jgi:hypothetical protein
LCTQVSENPSPPEVKALGFARVAPALVVIVISCGPVFVVNEETGSSDPPVEASALENAIDPKFVSLALPQKPRRQVSGASATHSAELLASLPVLVIENVQPSLLCSDSV